MLKPEAVSAWVVHLPHASKVIPAAVRPDLLLSDEELADEIVRMTDHLTDQLVATALPAAPRVVFPVSRLVVDPERFPQDADEPMSRVGMGVIYERTSHGRPLRALPDPAARRRLLATYYVPHHAALESAVTTALAHVPAKWTPVRRQEHAQRKESHGHCTILDVHSFPSRPLPYELDQAPDRADICIGTDDFHTPQPLAQAFVQCFSDEGLTVAVNRPFGGTLVPMRYFRADDRVMSIMLEVNRRLYLDETTGQANERFADTQRLLARVLANVAETPASLARSTD